MASQTTPVCEDGSAHDTSFVPGKTIPFEGVNKPGTYVCKWSGHLLRVPEADVSTGPWPRMNMFGHGPMFVTGISDDPYIPMTKARLLASNFDLNVNF